MDTFAKSRVVDMIKGHNEIVDHIVNHRGTGMDVYLLANGTTLRLPTGNKRFSFNEVWLIADGKLNMSSWEFEEWLGEQG